MDKEILLSMEVQKWIEENLTDYLSKMKKLNLKVNTYNGLTIVRSNRNREYDLESYPWIRFCRGLVIDRESNRVVFVPPEKSVELSLDEVRNKKDDFTKYQPLIDGTMINLFYHRNEWILTTRSSIGANNRWDGNDSFRSLFFSIIEKDKLFEQLNKKMTYSFVLVHQKCRNVSCVEQNMIILVEQYLKSENNIVKSELDTIIGVANINEFTSDFIEEYDKDLYFSIKGFTAKNDKQRIKYINPNFSRVQDLKINYNNKLLHYIELRQNSNLTEYLTYFPEESHNFMMYRDIFNEIKHDLYSSYQSCFVKKRAKLREVDYYMRPLLIELHKQYLETKNVTTMSVVSDYMHNLPSKRFAYIYNCFSASS